MDRADARRWIAGFEAAAAEDREALRLRGADPAWSIAVALSMIDAAERAGRGGPADIELRQAEDERVRATWDRLRARLRQ